MTKRKIFLGTQEIAGIMLKIHRELDRRGINNTFLCFWEYPAAGKNAQEYENKELNTYFKCVRMGRKCKEKNKKMGRKVALFAEMFVVLGIFFKALFRYNTFFFVYGQGIFRNTLYLKNMQDVEFFLYRLFKKKVIVMFVGSDSRPPYCGKFTESLDKLRDEVEWNYKKVRRMEKYADVVIDNPASSYFHRKPFVQSAYVGNIVSDEDLATNAKENSGKNESAPVVILHAPSHPGSKGTDQVRLLMKEMKAEGFNIYYDEITGVPHEEVIKHIGNADVVINELYSDFPMSMLDTEASLNGVPVVTCGYFAKYYKEYMMNPLPPTVYCTPDELKERVVKLVKNKEYREEIGKLERQFVIENWKDRIVVEKILGMADGVIPEEALFNPYDSEYLWGSGCSKENALKRVSFLIEKYGEHSLRLDDKPKLKSKYMEMYKRKKY